MDKTVETNFSIVEPTPEPIVEPSTDFEERLAQLEAENKLLKEKIEDLNQLILKQLRIIVEWINK